MLTHVNTSRPLRHVHVTGIKCRMPIHFTRTSQILECCSALLDMAGVCNSSHLVRGQSGFAAKHQHIEKLGC